MIGGVNHRKDAWQYDVRTNAWSGMADSETAYSIYVSLFTYDNKGRLQKKTSA